MIIYAVKIQLFSLGLALLTEGCGEQEKQERARSGGTPGDPGLVNSETSTDTPSEKSDDTTETIITEDPNLPAQVSGAFLNSTFCQALADKKSDETSVCGHIRKSGANVDLSALVVKGQVLNSTTGNIVKTYAFTALGANQEFHFKFNLKTSELPTAQNKVLLTDTKSNKTGALTMDLADLSGKILDITSPKRSFDFLQVTTNTLKAADYCDETGPFSSVYQSKDGKQVAIASMDAPNDLNLSQGNYCFRKITGYVSGGQETTLLGADEHIDSFVGLGPRTGSTSGACLFVVIEPLKSKLGKDPLLYIFDNSAAVRRDLRKTAFDAACP